MIAFVVLANVGAAMAQQNSPSTEDLENAYTWCTHRYYDHTTSPASKWNRNGKWQSGFEGCAKIVAETEARRMEWNDINQHKSKIDAVAAGIK